MFLATTSKFKPYVWLLLFSLVLSSCSHKLKRTEYSLKKSERKECQVPIKKYYTVSEEVGEKIGKINLDGRKGYGIAGTELQAYNIMIGEACALGADLIIITGEERPGRKRSTYRCAAWFYRLKDTESPLKKAYLTQSEWEAIKERSKKQKKKGYTKLIGYSLAIFLLALL